MINVQEIQQKLNIAFNLAKKGGYEVNFSDGTKEKYPRVTTICGYLSSASALDNWKKKMIREAIESRMAAPDLFMNTPEGISSFAKDVTEAASAYTEAAAEFGTAMHKYIEHFLLTGERLSVEEVGYTGTYSDISQIIKSVDIFLDKFGFGTDKVVVIKPECFLFSKKYGYAGNCDLICYNVTKNAIYIFDWKSSNALRSSYKAQVAAYRQAFEELTGLSIAGAFLVRFKKEGDGYEMCYLMPTQLDDAFQAFLNALAIYKFDKTDKVDLM